VLNKENNMKLNEIAVPSISKEKLEQYLDMLGYNLDTISPNDIEWMMDNFHTIGKRFLKQVVAFEWNSSLQTYEILEEPQSFYWNMNYTQFHLFSSREHCLQTINTSMKNKNHTLGDSGTHELWDTMFEEFSEYTKKLTNVDYYKMFNRDWYLVVKR